MNAEATRGYRGDVARYIEQHLGLNFPSHRWRDLERGLVRASDTQGFRGLDEFCEWLIREPHNAVELASIASHLTVGETYFFRDQKFFQALEQRVLPALIGMRSGERRLRIWSAGCATGEEAYSVAILLRRLLGRPQDWDLSILATDINPASLKRARSGIYGEWSFRDAPPWLKDDYFQRRPGKRHEISPAIREMVSFEILNLAGGAYPALATRTASLDLVLCRNVLMYFSPEVMARVAGQLASTLLPGGWLAAAPSESSQRLFPGLRVRNFEGAILFEKPGLVGSRPSLSMGMPREAAASPAGTLKRRTVEAPRDRRPKPAARAAKEASLKLAEKLFHSQRYLEAKAEAERVVAALPDEVGAQVLLVRLCANEGRLDEAEQWCERASALDRANPLLHYLRGLVQLEQGRADAAQRSFRNCVFLAPDFLMAHVQAGLAQKRLGDKAEARKSWRNALRLLGGVEAESEIPESEGMTAERLREHLSLALALEGT